MLHFFETQCRDDLVHSSVDSKLYCLVGGDHGTLRLFVSSMPYKYSYLLNLSDQFIHIFLNLLILAVKEF